jgi:hypothetical protein
MLRLPNELGRNRRLGAHVSMEGADPVVQAFWLSGAAPGFDAAVVPWLGRRGVTVHELSPEPRSINVPYLRRVLRMAAYQRKLRRLSSVPLVLPYLAGDTLLLAGVRGHRTLGVAVGSDVYRRPRTARHEKWFRRALVRLDGLWCVSQELAEEVKASGRPADWVASVGVDVGSLLPPPETAPERNRIFSARMDAPVYRRDWIRAVTAGRDWNLVEADGWSRDRMMTEYGRAEIVVSIPSSDGAPATVMEALCMGAHVVASGGATVRLWLDRFGGTYGEPGTVPQVLDLLILGLYNARRETLHLRNERARAARDAFERDSLLIPLERWLQTSGG